MARSMEKTIGDCGYFSSRAFHRTDGRSSLDRGFEWRRTNNVPGRWLNEALSNRPSLSLSRRAFHFCHVAREKVTDALSLACFLQTEKREGSLRVVFLTAAHFDVRSPTAGIRRSRSQSEMVIKREAHDLK